MSDLRKVNVERLKVRPEEINKATGRIMLDVDAPSPRAVPAHTVSVARPGTAPTAGAVRSSFPATATLIGLILMSVLCVASLMLAWQALARSKELMTRLGRAEEMLAAFQNAGLPGGEKIARDLGRMDRRLEAFDKGNAKRDEEIASLRAQTAALQAKVALMSQVEEVEEIIPGREK